jgi:hypothetical protein
VCRVKGDPRDRALTSNDFVISRKTVAVSDSKSLGGIVSCWLVVAQINRESSAVRRFRDMAGNEGTYRPFTFERKVGI